MIESIRYRLLKRRLRREIARTLFFDRPARVQMPVKSTCKAVGSIV